MTHVQALTVELEKQTSWNELASWKNELRFLASSQIRSISSKIDFSLAENDKQLLMPQQKPNFIYLLN